MGRGGTLWPKGSLNLDVLEQRSRKDLEDYVYILLFYMIFVFKITDVVLPVSYSMEIIKLGLELVLIIRGQSFFFSSSSSSNCLCQPAIDLVCWRAFRGRVPGGSWPGTRTNTRARR